MTLTPDQERRRRGEIDRCAKDWEFYTPTLEIQRKIKGDLSLIEKIRNWPIEKIWKRTYKVKTLYQWSKELFAQSDMMKYQFPFTADNIKKPKSISTIFALSGRWSIPESDQKALTHGPLLNQEGEELVKEGTLALRLGKKWWPVIAALATLLGLIKCIAWLLGRE